MSRWKNADEHWKQMVARGARWASEVPPAELAVAHAEGRILSLHGWRDGFGGGTVAVSIPDTLEKCESRLGQWEKDESVVFEFRVGERDLAALSGNAWESIPSLRTT